MRPLNLIGWSAPFCREAWSSEATPRKALGRHSGVDPSCRLMAPGLAPRVAPEVAPLDFFLAPRVAPQVAPRVAPQPAPLDFFLAPRPAHLDFCSGSPRFFPAPLDFAPRQNEIFSRLP